MTDTHLIAILLIIIFVSGWVGYCIGQIKANYRAIKLIDGIINDMRRERYEKSKRVQG